MTAPPNLDLLPAPRSLPQATQSQSNYNTQGLALGTIMIFLPSLQLTVALEWWLRGHLRRIRDNCLGKCTDIPPGHGCKPHLVLLAPPDKIACSVVSFGTLSNSHFGAKWGSSRPDHEDILDCTGIPLLRVLGPEPVAVYQLPDHQRYRMSRCL